MLSILRQMTIEELRYAAAACGAEPTPEGVVRALCRECMILGWGFVPISREDALFEQISQRLGAPPGPRGAAGVSVMERRVYASLVRRAWEAADASYQRQVLEAACSLWDAESASLPQLPPHEEPLGLRATLDALVTQPAGLRSLAAAMETVPLVFPTPEALPPGMMPDMGLARPLGLRTRADRGYPALFHVLTICWRARRRLLSERRVQYQHLRRQIRQLTSTVEQRVKELQGLSAPWGRHWMRGLSVAGGAAAASVMQAAMHADPFLGWLATGAGLLWSVIAWSAQPRAEADPRYARLQREIAAARQRLAVVHHSILALEAE